MSAPTKVVGDRDTPGHDTEKSGHDKEKPGHDKGKPGHDTGKRVTTQESRIMAQQTRSWHSKRGHDTGNVARKQNLPEVGGQFGANGFGDNRHMAVVRVIEPQYNLGIGGGEGSDLIHGEREVHELDR